MDSTSGQSVRTDARPHSGQTRQRLLHAAVELITELGWGRVTTRAVAERAELPHGTVSYHFRGKQELLREAAVHAFEAAFGGLTAAFDRVGGIVELVPEITAWADRLDDPALLGVGMEAMRESERDPVLREQFVAMLRDYRSRTAELVSADQRRGALPSGPSPSGVATLLTAAVDGLLLHALLDPELEVHEALHALLALLADDGHDEYTERDR